MKMFSIVFCGLMLIACEETKELQSFDASNARQEEGDDFCDGYYQGCVDKGYPEEACAEKADSCDEWVNEEFDCEEYSLKIYDICIDDGYEEDVCQDKSDVVYEECLLKEESWSEAEEEWKLKEDKESEDKDYLEKKDEKGKLEDKEFCKEKDWKKIKKLKFYKKEKDEKEEI